MLEWVVKYWVEWLFGALLALLAAGYKQLSNQIKKKREEDTALKDGVLAILHDRLYQSSQFYIKQGSVDVNGMKNLEVLYKSYHALGGNGTGTDLYNRVRSLPYKED